MYKSKLQNEAMDDLFKAVLLLENEEECYRFFEDLCTINELISLAQRWQVAKDLDMGITYGVIADKTEASSATISRVNRSLQYGADGYRLILDRMKEETK